jgi:antitoxin ParD1/3/4
MPARNVNLTQHQDEFIEERIKAGRFTDASDVVREGLRLLEQKEAEDEAKLECLRSMTKEAFAALDRGEYITLSSAQDVDVLVNEALAEVKAARA